MAAFSGQFEYLAPGRGVEQSGACELSFDEQTFTLVPAGRPADGLRSRRHRRRLAR